MSRKRFSCGCRLSMIVIVVALLCSAVPAGAQEAASRQAQVLADLAARIVTCSVHPCPGDSEQDVRRLLKGKIVSDGVFNYSDIAVGYPVTKGVLSGLVEWHFQDKLDLVSFKIVDFHLAPSVLIDQVEQTLPGCEMDQEPSDCVMESAEADHEDDETQEWGCMADVEGTDGLLVQVYRVRGLILFEIGS